MLKRTQLGLLLVVVVSGAIGVEACVGDEPAAPADGDGGGDGAATDSATGDGSSGDAAGGDGGDSGTLLKPSDPVGIAAGLSHACAVRFDHQVFCWGRDAEGELGPNGTGADTAQPVVVPFGTGVNPIALFAGPHSTCAIDDAGGVWCWGSNQEFALGIGSDDAGIFRLPQRVVTASGNLVAALPPAGAGAVNNNAGGLVVASDHSLVGWGSSPNNAYGFNSLSSKLAVVANVSAGNMPVLSVTTGGDHSIAVVTHGGVPTVAAWGLNSLDELGTLDAGLVTLNPAYPTLPNGGTVAIAAAGGQHSCAVDTTGLLSCWGRNVDHELGKSGASSPQPTPNTNVDFQSDRVTALALGTASTCVIVESGDVYCFGKNDVGELSQLGAGSTSIPRVQVMSIAHDAVAIAAGDSFYCVIRQGIVAGGRSVWCWGGNADQQLGAADAGRICGSACSPDPIEVPLPP